MKKFQRALIAMDLSEMDQKLLHFTKLLTYIFPIQKLYFVHIMPDFTIPENLDAEFHKLFAPEYPIDEKIRDKIALDVQETLGAPPNLQIAVNVIEGNPYEKLIHWTKVKEIDLLIVGQKEISNGSGITAKRVARQSKCNVLFVPESAGEELKKILVPIDFSENAARAIKEALRIKDLLPGVSVETLYVVDLPPDSYFMRSIEDNDFKSLLVESAEESYLQFLKKNDFNPEEIEPVFLENDFVNIAAHIEDYVKESQPDLVLMGAKGHSRLENFFYGSVTEKFVDRCKELPIMIIR